MGMSRAEIKTLPPQPGMYLAVNIKSRSRAEMENAIIRDVAVRISDLLDEREWLYMDMEYYRFVNGVHETEVYVASYPTLVDDYGNPGTALLAHTWLPSPREYFFTLRLVRGMPVADIMRRLLDLTMYSRWGFIRHAAQLLMDVYKAGTVFKAVDKSLNYYSVYL